MKAMQEQLEQQQKQSERHETQIRFINKNHSSIIFFNLQLYILVESTFFFYFKKSIAIAITVKYFKIVL